jgi:exodeoxyribonuclease V alpha subunit
LTTIALAATLIDAVPTRARLVLVGDSDQLPSVGPGRVLHDVIASKVVTTVRLTEIFRQAAASAIVVNAHKVNRGEIPDTKPQEGADFYFLPREEPSEVVATIKQVVAERIPRRLGVDRIDGVQVLSPMHRGDVGTQKLNAELQELLNPARPGVRELVHGSRTFRVGDKVIQNRNDYDKDVFNGDVGRVVEVFDGESGRGVIVDFEGRSIPYDIQEVDQIALAYALSVHKAQGSEYPAVVVPIVTQHFLMLKRNLVYTAMTRGKKFVVLVGTKKALAIAVKNDDTRLRWTWLAERLRKAATSVVPSAPGGVTHGLF